MLPHWHAEDAAFHFAHPGSSNESGFPPFAPPHFIPFTGFAFPEHGKHFGLPMAEPFVDHSLVFDPHIGQTQLQPFFCDGVHAGYLYPAAHPPHIDHGGQLPQPHHHPVFIHDSRFAPTGLDGAHPPLIPTFYPPLQPIVPVSPPYAYPHPPPYSHPLPLPPPPSFIKSSPPISQSKVQPPSKAPVPPKASTPQRKPVHRPSVSVSATKTKSSASNHHRRNITLVETQRSVFLEHFRNSRYNEDWPLKAIFGHVVEFSLDQHGSRFIQGQLEKATEHEKAIIFSEIYPRDVDKLIRDVFGNYVLQKFFDLGTEGQKSCLVRSMEQNIFDLSTHIYGCRVVQKALDSVSEEHQGSIIRSLSPRILECIKDAHGNHVVQKIVEVVPPCRLSFIHQLCENILDLATHSFGCRVLQRALEHLTPDYAKPLLDAIFQHTTQLMKDQYGNYVIQFILQRGSDDQKSKVVSSVAGKLVVLSCHKFASNVCEKALMFSHHEIQNALIDELMSSSQRLQTMAKDPYGNYVLQRALTVSSGPQREAFFAFVRPILAELRKASSQYSRPLVSLERLMNSHFEGGHHDTPATLVPSH